MYHRRYVAHICPSGSYPSNIKKRDIDFDPIAASTAEEDDGTLIAWYHNNVEDIPTSSTTSAGAVLSSAMAEPEGWHRGILSNINRYQQPVSSVEAAEMIDATNCSVAVTEDVVEDIGEEERYDMGALGSSSNTSSREVFNVMHSYSR